MKIPLIGSLGLDTKTALILVIAGTAAFATAHYLGTKGDGDGDADDYAVASEMKHRGHSHHEIAQEIHKRRMHRHHHHDHEGGMMHHHGGKNFDISKNIYHKDHDPETLHEHHHYGGKHHHFGLEMGHGPHHKMFHDNFRNNISGSFYHPRGISAYSGRAYATDATSGGCVQNQMCTTDSHWDSTQCACIPNTVTPVPVSSPAITSLENKILSLITQQAQNISTVIPNLDTIKATIATYAGQLQTATQQQAAGVITAAQMDQYLQSLVTDIASKLQIQLNPPGTMTGGGGPGGTGSPNDYYTQYYQQYQQYLNNLNNNYYNYYKAPYQYYPGQQYNYYQPYQYQMPSPYTAPGQYQYSYPNYGVGQYMQYPQYYQSYYPNYGIDYDGGGGLINIGSGGGGGLINIGSGGGGGGGGLLGGLLGSIF